MRRRLPILIAFLIVTAIIVMAFVLRSTADRPPEKVDHMQLVTRDTRLAAGLTHSLYIDAKGQLWTWGDSDFKKTVNTSPVKVADNVCMVAAGDSSKTSFYIDCKGTLYGWGTSSVGQIGLVSDSPVIEPMPIMTDIRFIAPGHDTPFAIDTSSALWTWGKSNPSRGEKMPGEDKTENIGEPEKVLELVQSVSSSATHTLALREDRSLWVWGTNDSGALSIGSFIEQDRPYKANIAALQSKPIVKLATKNLASFAVTEDGELYVWGYANARLPGKKYTSVEPKKLPVRVEFVDHVADIALGDTCAVILKQDGSVWAYGIGELAQSEDSSWKEPVHIMDDVVEIAAGPHHALALKKDGSVWSWGENSHGQLGDGTTQKRIVPARISFPVK